MSNPPPSGPPQDGEPTWPSEPGAGGPPVGQPGGQPGEPAPPEPAGAGSSQPGPDGAQPTYTPGPEQPWGAPGEPPPDGTSKRKLLPFVIAGAAIVVVAVVLGVLLISNSGSSSSPKDTADEFVAAAEAHDCEKALSLITDHLKETENADCSSDSSLVPSEDQKVTFGEVTISGETDTTATASVDATLGTQTITVKLGMVKQDGDWKIDSFGS